MSGWIQATMQQNTIVNNPLLVGQFGFDTKICHLYPSGDP